MIVAEVLGSCLCGLQSMSAEILRGEEGRGAHSRLSVHGKASAESWGLRGAQRAEPSTGLGSWCE